MDLAVWWKGLVIGFSIAAPVGPIGVLCIRRTLTDGRLAGLLSGLGAATADAVYGSIAAFGLSVITNLLVGQQDWLRLIGGLFLCYLGGSTLLARPRASEPGEETLAGRGTGLAGAYLSTFVLTLTNPITILSFVAIFAGIGGMEAGGGLSTAGLMVLGVFVGSALWWLLLSGGVSLFRARFTPAAMHWVNRVSGVIILAFGLVALWGLLV